MDYGHQDALVHATSWPSRQAVFVRMSFLRVVFEGRKPFAEEDGEGMLFLPGKGVEESRLRKPPASRQASISRAFREFQILPQAMCTQAPTIRGRTT